MKMLLEIVIRKLMDENGPVKNFEHFFELIDIVLFTDFIYISCHVLTKFKTS